MPEHLKSGQTISSPTGVQAQVVVTRRRNEYGERLYRLRYRAGVVGAQEWTAAELGEIGAKLEGGK